MFEIINITIFKTRFKAEVGDEIMRLLTLPQPKVCFKLCISIVSKINPGYLAKHVHIKSSRAVRGRQQERRSAPSATRSRWSTTNWTSWSSALRRRRVRLRWEYWWGWWIIKWLWWWKRRCFVNISLVLFSNNQRYYMLSIIHIYVAMVSVKSLREWQSPYSLVVNYNYIQAFMLLCEYLEDDIGLTNWKTLAYGVWQYITSNTR